MKKTLILKKDTEICDDYNKKVLTFQCEIEDGEIQKVVGFMNVNMCDGSRGKIKLDWEISYYREKFWREFDELVATTKNQLTKRCIFN